MHALCQDELCGCQPTHSMHPASYEIRVPQAGCLPQASFRFHLTMDTLALWLTVTPDFTVRDFHPIDVRHARRTDILPHLRATRLRKGIPLTGCHLSTRLAGSCC